MHQFIIAGAKDVWVVPIAFTGIFPVKVVIPYQDVQPTESHEDAALRFGGASGWRRSDPGGGSRLRGNRVGF
jgi:hypothetical protein